MVPGIGGSEPEREARPNTGRRLFGLAGLVMTFARLVIFLFRVANGDVGMWAWGLAFSLMGQGAPPPK